MRNNLARWGSSALLLLALLVPTRVVHAQERGQFVVTPRLGLVFWDNAAAIQDPVLSSSDCDFPEFNQECVGTANNFMIGLSALYGVTDRLSLGVAFDVGRPVSNGAYFPAAGLAIGGLEGLTLINQRLTVVQYAFETEFAVTTGRIAPYVVGSAGGYTVYKEASKADFTSVSGFDTFGDFMFSLGAGLDLGISGGTGFRLELRDMVYTGWDRDELNPVLPEFQTSLFPDLLPEPPEASETLHNWRAVVAFTFVLGGVGSP